MKQKIKNKHYLKFLNEGEIQTLTEEDIEKALENITGKHRKEGRSLLICLYYTGARPNEVLRIRARDIITQGSYVLVKVAGSKGGLNRTIYLQSKRPMVKELLNYSKSIFKDQYLFFNFWSSYIRERHTPKGIKRYHEIANGLRYYFEKWFTGVMEDAPPPYYLRHNRFSKLSEAGATMSELRQIKGSKTEASIIPYLHMSSRHAKKLARKMD